MADIAELGYSIKTGEIDRADRSLDSMSGSANRATGAMGGMEKSVMRAATRLAAMVVSVQALRSGIGTLASYGQEMSTVRAITQATAGEFAALSDEARRLGATTRFSASEAAQGMSFLARAGFTADEALRATEGALTLAQAGALGLGQAADIASNVLTGFRLEVEHTGRVVDVLALAANSSNTTVGQLGEAMSMAAPVAAGLRVSVEETAAAIGALSDAGIQGTRAGTGLRRVMSTLEAPTAQAAAILTDLGLTTDQVKVSQVGLTQAMAALAQAGIDTGTALELFGDRGGPAFEVLSSSIPRVNELNASLQNASGTAERIAGVMDQNLNGALLAVRSASQELILAFGDLSGTGLEDAARGIADALRFVAANAGTVATAASAGAVGFVAYRTALMSSAVAASTFGTALQLMTVRGGAAIVMTQALTIATRALLGPLGIAIMVAAGAAGAFTLMGISQAEQARRAERAAEAQDAHNEAIRLADRLLEEHEHITRASSDADRDAIAARMGSRAAIIAYQDSLRGISPAAREAREASLAQMRAQTDQAEAAVAAAQANLELRRQIYGLAPRSELREEIEGLETDLITLTRAAEIARAVLARLAGQDVASFDPVSEAAARRLTEAERSLERQLTLANMRTETERAVASALWDAGLALDSQGEEAENIRRIATQIVAVTEQRAAAEERIREAQAQAQRRVQSLADARERLALVQIEDETQRSIAEAMLRAGFAMDDQSDAARQMLDYLTRILAIDRARADAALAASEAERQTADRLARIENLRMKIAGYAEMHVQHMADLNQLLIDGEITAGQFAAHMQAAQSSLMQMRVDAGDATGLESILAGLDLIAEKSRNTQAVIRDLTAEFTGTLASGIADSIGRSIVYADDLGDALSEVARTALAQLISSVIEYGIQAAISAAIGQSVGAAATAASAGQAALLAASWAPAAAAASLATLGANAVPAMAGMTATHALSQALAMVPGFQSGTSWTGSGPVSGIAGIVHNQEAVLNASARRGIGAQAVDYMNRNHTLPPSNDNGAGGGKPSVNIDMRGAMVTREAVEDLRSGLERLGYRVDMVDQGIPDRVRTTMVEDRERGVA